MADDEYDSVLSPPGSLGSLERRINALLEAWQERDDNASEGRRRLYDKVEGAVDGMIEVREDVAELREKVVSLTERLEKAETPIEDFKLLRANVRGGMIVLGFIGATLFTAAGFLLREFWGWIHSHLRFQ